MKLLFFLAIMLCALQLPAQLVGTDSPFPEDTVRRRLRPEDVPADIVKDFNKRILNTVPSWTGNDSAYAAAYVDSAGLAHVLTYDITGDLQHRQDELGAMAFPPVIERYHDKFFPGEGLTVWQSVDGAGNRMYYFTHKGQTIWFDGKGGLVSAK